MIKFTDREINIITSIPPVDDIKPSLSMPTICIHDSYLIATNGRIAYVLWDMIRFMGMDGVIPCYDIKAEVPKAAFRKTAEYTLITGKIKTLLEDIPMGDLTWPPLPLWAHFSDIICAMRADGRTLDIRNAWPILSALDVPEADLHAVRTDNSVWFRKTPTEFVRIVDREFKLTEVV